MSSPQRFLRSAVFTALIAAIGLFALSSTADAGQTQTYIILYKGGASSADAGSTIQKAGGTLVHNYSQIGVAIARSASPSFSDRMSRNARVEGVTATAPFAVKLDDDFAETGAAAAAVSGGLADGGDNLSNHQWDMVQMHVPEAHETTLGDPSVVVGDIDTGLDEHPDLVANIDYDNSVSCETGAPNQDPAAWDDKVGHGTHTAGTIAAAANGIGIVGVAPDVKIAGIKSSNDDGFFFPEMVICSFIWAAEQDIDVTNNSYFADPWLFNCRNDPEQHAIWKAEQRAIRYAMQRGVVVVASAGNENHDLSKKNIDTISPDFPPGNEQEREVTNACVVIPVEIPGVLGVSANGVLGDKSFYSNYGVGVVDVVAPGGDSLQTTPDAPNGRVLSALPPDSALAAILPPALKFTDPDDGSLYGYLQGTSMAGPHAAGVAALIRSLHPNMPPGAVSALLKSSADPQDCPPNPYVPVHPAAGPFPAICVGGSGYNGFYGHGLVDAEAAVD